MKLNQVYLLKESFGPPDKYIGAIVNNVQLEYGITVWSMTCVEYMHGDINNVPLVLECNKAALKSFWCVHRPYPSYYRPEMDVTD